MRMTHRTMTVLTVISAEPGLSNVQVGKRAGIADKGQTSRLLARLSRLGLAANTGGQPMGEANAWQLTPRGEEVEFTLRQALLGLAANRTSDHTIGVPA